jgi:cell wall-associated NlpC family hydrolase
MSQDFPVPAETAKAPKGSVARLIQVAKSQVGYIEGPKDNETKYGAYTKANFQPWCGSFVNWCGNEAGVKIPNTVYTPGGAAAFKKAGAWIDGDIADPEPGDIAYFDFPSDGVDRISHVGIVIEDNEDGTVWCIEGNTSSKKSGSQRNGGEACKQLRAFKKNKAGVQVSIVGFGRPKFKSGGAAKPAATSSTGVCPTCGK